MYVFSYLFGQDLKPLRISIRLNRVGYVRSHFSGRCQSGTEFVPVFYLQSLQNNLSGNVFHPLHTKGKQFITENKRTMWARHPFTSWSTWTHKRVKGRSNLKTSLNQILKWKSGWNWVKNGRALADRNI